MLELERTYLAKEIPEINSCKCKEIIDIYIPKEGPHPKLRIRKNGEKYEITKKEPEKEGDFSRLVEQTIVLKEKEFDSLSKIDGRKVHKIRYYYPYKNFIAEIDVFLEDLKGLVLVDFEFNSEKEKNEFKMPDFCLCEVTDKEFVAGGFLCGKSYDDLEDSLKKLGYEKLKLNKSY